MLKSNTETPATSPSGSGEAPNAMLGAFAAMLAAAEHDNPSQRAGKQHMADAPASIAASSAGNSHSTRRGHGDVRNSATHHHAESASAASVDATTYSTVRHARRSSAAALTDDVSAGRHTHAHASPAANVHAQPASRYSMSEEEDSDLEDDLLDEDEEEADLEGASASQAGVRSRSAGGIQPPAAKRARTNDDSRLTRRRALNRANAKKSRQRKKQYFDQLEERMNALEAECSTYRTYLRAVVHVAPEAVLAGSAPRTRAELVRNPTLASSGGSTISSDEPESSGRSSAPTATAAALLASVPGVVGSALDAGVIAALQRIRSSFCLSDPSLPDNPIVWASAGFLELTGYSASEVLGRNCRFLQGPSTNKADVKELAKALAEGRQHSTLLLNYKKDGTCFMNHLTVAPLKDIDGRITSYVGVQCEVPSSSGSVLSSSSTITVASAAAESGPRMSSGTVSSPSPSSSSS